MARPVAITSIVWCVASVVVLVTMPSPRGTKRIASRSFLLVLVVHLAIVGAMLWLTTGIASVLEGIAC